MNRLIYRQLLTNQLVIMDALACLGAPVRGTTMPENIHATRELLASSDLCEHDWHKGVCKRCNANDWDIPEAEL